MSKPAILTADDPMVSADPPDQRMPEMTGSDMLERARTDLVRLCLATV